MLRLFDVQPARVHVIHNGIDPAEYRPTGATDALQRHGIESDDRMFCCAHCAEHEGVDEAVDRVS